MNLLPLFVIYMLMKNGGGFDLSGILNDTETLAPIMNMFGINPSILDALKGGGIMSPDGKPDIKKLLSLAGALTGSMRSETQKKEPDGEVYSEGSFYLKPISEIADSGINYALSHYFANS